MLIPQADSKTKAHGLPPRSQDAPASWVHLVSSASHYSSAAQLLDLTSRLPPPNPGSGGGACPRHRTIASSVNRQSGPGVTGP